MVFNNIFKSFSSLFNNDNNNDNNNPTNDSNLNQGKQLLKYELLYKKNVIPHLKPLQLTTSPNLSSIVESLDNITFVNNTNTTSMENEKQQYINKTVDTFNQKLTEYSNTYKLFIESLIQNTKDKGDVAQYYGKVIKDKDGSYIYINDYGFTHKYLSDSWELNDSSCPKNAEEVDTNLSNNILNKLSTGPNMGSGQACKIAGQNVQNIETNEVAWIDIKGFKHVYPSNVWNNKKNSCNINPIRLSSIAYNNIPNSTPMERNTECFKLNADNLLWEKIQALNYDLVVLSRELLFYLDDLKTDDLNLNKEIDERKLKINEYIKMFENSKTDINTINSSYETVSGQVSQSATYTKSYQYQYTIWILLAILILIAILRTTMDGENTTFISSIVVLILIFILYYILKILY